jgi:hypothetical protein
VLLGGYRWKKAVAVVALCSRTSSKRHLLLYSSRRHIYLYFILSYVTVFVHVPHTIAQCFLKNLVNCAARGEV